MWTNWRSLWRPKTGPRGKDALVHTGYCVVILIEVVESEDAYDVIHSAPVETQLRSYRNERKQWTA